MKSFVRQTPHGIYKSIKMHKNDQPSVFISSISAACKTMLYDLNSFLTEVSKPVFCKENQWTAFYMIRTAVTKELNKIHVPETNSNNFFCK